MLKEFFEYLKTKKNKEIIKLKTEQEQIKVLNTLVLKQLLDEVKNDLYAVVTLADGTRIELHQTRFKDLNTEKKYNEYW